MNDMTSAQFYEDPDNLKPVGPPKRPNRRVSSRLVSHVPVRFTAALISAVKRLADEDGVTVSSWIRGLVEREATRRLSAQNTTGATVIVAPFPQPQPPTTVNRTQERQQALG